MNDLPAEASDVFVWFSPLELLQHRMMDPTLAGRVHWRCGAKFENGERVFEGVTTGDASIAAQERFCKSKDELILIVSFYADGTALTGDGRTSAHPIYMEFMQQRDADRLALTGPMLVGLMPVVSNEGEKLSDPRQRLYQHCMEVLAEDLKAGAQGLVFHGRFGTHAPSD